jgi:ankyrin repeat protein
MPPRTQVPERRIRLKPCPYPTISLILQRGGTALMGAVVAGHTDVVELLLSNGATVDASDKVRSNLSTHTFRYRPLLPFDAKNHLSLLQVGYTPLILATIHDQAAVLEQLIIAGANYEQTDNVRFMFPY